MRMISYGSLISRTYRYTPSSLSYRWDIDVYINECFEETSRDPISEKVKLGDAVPASQLDSRSIVSHNIDLRRPGLNLYDHLPSD